MAYEPNPGALKNPEVVRCLDYMASFAQSSNAVARLMDRLTHSPTVGAVFTKKHHAPDDPDNEKSVPHPTAEMASDAVAWAEGEGDKPAWLTQCGITETVWPPN